jgi:hypothetical protein
MTTNCNCGCGEQTTITSSGYAYNLGGMTNHEKNSFIDTLQRVLEGPYNEKKEHCLSPAERKIVQDKLIELIQSINVS